LETYRLELLMQNYGLSDIGPRRFIEFVKSNTRIHFKVGEWRAAMERFDFVVGSRFHGSLIAALAGVPCFVYAHDARTKELCELLRLPHRPVTEQGSVDIDALYDSLDLSPLERTYRQLYENYIQFLEENGFKHNLAMRRQEGRNGAESLRHTELTDNLPTLTPEFVSGSAEPEAPRVS